MTNNETTTVTLRARRAKTPPASAPAHVPAASAAPTKSATVIKLLLRAKGATAMELIAATDWQPHSVRAFLSGLRKKGRVLAREPRKTGEAAYRIVAVETDIVTKDGVAGEGNIGAGVGADTDPTGVVPDPGADANVEGSLPAGDATIKV